MAGGLIRNWTNKPWMAAPLIKDRRTYLDQSQPAVLVHRPIIGATLNYSLNLAQHRDILCQNTALSVSIFNASIIGKGSAPRVSFCSKSLSREKGVMCGWEILKLVTILDLNQIPCKSSCRFPTGAAGSPCQRMLWRSG